MKLEMKREALPLGVHSTLWIEKIAPAIPRSQWGRPSQAARFQRKEGSSPSALRLLSRIG
jgi:hypothetical protein